MPHRRQQEIRNRKKIGRPSALSTGLGREDGDALLHLCAFALRTGNLGRAVLGDALYDGKFPFALLAFVLVCGHVPPPFPGYRIQIKIPITLFVLS
jgi:hypothetical protein